MKPPMIVVLGSAKVGKSSLIQRFIENKFPQAHVPTTEDLYTQVMKCPDGLYRAIEILDTSGGDEFPVMRDLRIKQGDMFIVVYSVDDLYSLKAAVSLCRSVHTIKGDDDVALLLVGNKIDIATRAVSSELVLDLSKDLRCSHIEASAKLDVNIQGIFSTLLEMKHFPSKEKKKKDGDGNVAGACSLFRCFSPDTKPKRCFQRSYTFSGITDDGYTKVSSKIKRQLSANVPLESVPSPPVIKRS